MIVCFMTYLKHCVMQRLKSKTRGFGDGIKYFSGYEVEKRQDLRQMEIP